MRNHLLAALALVVIVGIGAPARADIDLEGTLLIGSGVDTGSRPHNPYALQVGGQLELIVFGFVGGVRATYALSSGDVPTRLDLRTFGGDIGYEWEIAMLHIGPRLGLGYLSTIKREEFESFYLEPGVVAEVEIGWFVVGGDLRYRIVTERMNMNGVLVYGKIGFRF